MDGWMDRWLGTLSGGSLYSRRPALERGDREQRHHSRKDIVEVEITILPDPLTDHRVINIPILVEDEKPPREEK